MKFLTLTLALALAGPAAAQATGDIILQKKTSTGYAPAPITPVNGRVLSWSNGAPVNLDLAATYQPLIADGALTIAKTNLLQAALDSKATTSHAHAWATLTAKPTTLAGYGITDAPTGSGTSTGTNTGDQTNISGNAATATIASAAASGFTVNYLGTPEPLIANPNGRFFDSIGRANAIVSSAITNGSITSAMLTNLKLDAASGSLTVAANTTKNITATDRGKDINCNGNFTISMPSAVGLNGMRIYHFAETGTTTLAGESVSSENGFSFETQITGQMGRCIIEARDGVWFLIRGQKYGPGLSGMGAGVGVALGTELSAAGGLQLNNGSGASLTALSANALATGTVPLARLVSTQTFAANSGGTILAGTRDAILAAAAAATTGVYVLPTATTANGYPAGARVTFTDMSNSLSATITATLQPVTGGSLNGIVNGTLRLATAGAAPMLISDGAGKWNADIRGQSRGGTGSTDGSIIGLGALTFTAGGTNQNITLTPSGTGSVMVKSGAAGSHNLLSFRDSSNALMSFIRADNGAFYGQFITPDIQSLNFANNTFALKNSLPIQWSADGNFYGTKDTGISRKTGGPGIVRVGNGTANDASGTVELANLTASGALAVTGASTLTGAVTAGAGITQSPPATATPVTNGQMLFEATSNTSLTVKLKGTDGTVRSVVLTLAP